MKFRAVRWKVSAWGLGLAAVLGGCFSLTAADREVLFGEELVFERAGEPRTYRRVMPAQPARRILLMLHSFGGSGRRIAYLSGVHNALGPETLVLYPNAIPPQSAEYEPGWNAGYCCGSGWVGEVEDLDFLMDLIAAYALEFNVPSERIFVAGFSNGAMMAMRLAAEHPERLGGVVAASGSVGTQEGCLDLQGPLPILLMHGERDELVPFQGGPGASDKSIVWLSFDETRRLWEARNAESGTLTRVLTFAEDGHRWHDWRLTRFWNRRPGASEILAAFLDEVEAGRTAAPVR